MGVWELSSLKVENLSGCDILCNSTINSRKLREVFTCLHLKAILFASFAVKLILLCLKNACWLAWIAETILAAHLVWLKKRMAMLMWQASRMIMSSTLDNKISAKRVKRRLSVKLKQNNWKYVLSAKKTNSSLLFILPWPAKYSSINIQTLDDIYGAQLLINSHSFCTTTYFGSFP